MDRHSSQGLALHKVRHNLSDTGIAMLMTNKEIVRHCNHLRKCHLSISLSSFLMISQVCSMWMALASGGACQGCSGICAGCAGPGVGRWRAQQGAQASVIRCHDDRPGRRQFTHHALDPASALQPLVSMNGVMVKPHVKLTLMPPTAWSVKGRCYPVRLVVHR